MSAPADFVSSLIQHPYLVSSSVLGTLVALKKFGSAAKTAILGGLKGLQELVRGLLDFFAGCHAHWWRFKSRCADNRRRHEKPRDESVRSLAHRAGAD